MTQNDASLSDRLQSVRDGVSAAARESGRSWEEITTIVVTKFHPVTLIRQLYDLGVRDFGENRHQEAQAKASELAGLEMTWHFVGQLQSKKAKQVRSYASVIHSLDRDSVIDALASSDNASAEERLDCFVQLNLTDDDARGGAQGPELERMAEKIASAAGLRLLGVMAVAPLGVEPRRAFARIRRASERVVAVEPSATFISAGMSGDYREAILEGATHLRIGSAITGNRPVAG